MIRNFKSEIYQKDGIIDAKKLFTDVEKAVEDEKKERNVERLGRGNPLQHLLNSTSAGYVSPTAMKGFEQCPANYLYSKLVPEKIGSATSVGSTVHTILQKFYDQKPEDRTKEKLYELMKKQIEEDGQEDSRKLINQYIDGYWDAPDYLTGRPMDHKNLVCTTETFIKPKTKPLGIDLTVPIYTLVDRIDIRDDGIYIIDYKTGIGDPNPYLLGEHGYLPQMIFYKWAVEAEYGQEVKGVYLCLPGADSIKYKYVKMNVGSLVEQSKVIEIVYNHLEHARNIRETRQFPESTMRYCNSCQMKTFCAAYIKSDKNRSGLDESNIKETISVDITYDDQGDFE